MYRLGFFFACALLLACGPTGLAPTAVSSIATPAPEPSPTGAVPTRTATIPAQPPPTATPSAAPTETTEPASPTVPPTDTPTPNPTGTPGPIAHRDARVESALVGFDRPPGVPTVYEMADRDDLVLATFRFEADGRCGMTVGCLTLFDAAAYATDIPGGDFNIALLQNAIANGGTTDFPTVGAAILVSAKNQIVPFLSGSGLRGLVMRGQDGYFANNEALFYNFYGLSTDERILVEVEIPASAPFLMDTYDPAANTNPEALPVPPAPADPADWFDLLLSYNQEAEARLEAMPAAQLTPDLDALDAMVASIQLYLE